LWICVPVRTHILNPCKGKYGTGTPINEGSTGKFYSVILLLHLTETYR
jgi:hypothetical protein